MTVTISGTSGIVNDATDLNYTGTLTGSTGVVNIGSGQVYKDASGNVGIGTASPTNFQPFGFGPTVEARGGHGGSFIASNSDYTVRTVLSNTSGATAGVLKTLTNHPLVFGTNDTERARIDSSGNLLVGTTNAGAKLTVVANNASANGSAYIQNDTGTAGSGVIYSNFSNASATSSSYYFLVGRNGGGSTYVLRADGTSTFSSDIRLKKNIVDAPSYLGKLNQLRPVNYQWNYQSDADETTSLGLIAQEVEQVFPNLVLEESFEEGQEARKSVKYSELPMMLLKAIQEQQAIITALTTRITALEAANV